MIRRLNMDFYEKLSDIFEEEVADETILKDLEAYDSLSILSIIAMVDKTYKKTITATEVRSVTTALELKEMIDKKA